MELLDTLVTLAPDDPSRPSVRERTIAAWLPMAQRLARRYSGRGESADDLAQTATVGLIKAIDRFDPGRGHFVGFALPTILGELKRYFRDKGWSVRVPRRLQEMHAAIGAAAPVLEQNLGRRPTITDIAGHLGVTVEEVVEGLESGVAYRAASLSAPVGSESAFELADTLGGDEQGYALAELRLALGSALTRLTDRERLIVTLRFYGNQSQTEIAQRVGVSQMHVSRLLSGALVKLRTDFADAA
nr:SigB/SigF/SigG family RNA polymerase sigma factor [uncultured Actinoplanes sp.]